MMFTLAFIVLSLAAAIQIIFIIRGKKADPVSHYLLLLAFVILIAAIIQRSIKIRFIAVTNTYEAVLFFTAFITLIAFIYKIRSKKETIVFIPFGATLLSLILLAIVSSPLFPKEILPPIPALQSSWLILHISFTFIGEAFFVISFFAAIFYLATKNEEKKVKLDRTVYIFIALGYPVYTTGALIFGAIWAQYAWGSYWNWDQKEVWALITWLVYTAYLHFRLIRKKKGRVTSLLAVLGFLLTLFTFFGVNYLLPSLHSYK